MNRIIAMLLAVMLMTGTAFAQKKGSTKATPAVEKADKKDAAKGAKVKKDGTPDMRYKDNKAKPADKPAGPLKKDGTPDMRHKSNKDATKKK